MPASIEGGSLLARRDAISRDYTVAYSMGPTARGDTSAGLYNRVWKAYEEGGAVYVARANDGNSEFETPELLFSYMGSTIEDLDLGFDSNGAAVIAAQRTGEVWLYWFDIRIPGNVFSLVSEGRTPRLIIDDPESTSAELLLFYLNDVTQRVEIRLQSENYEVDYLLPVDKWADLETGEAVLQTNTVNLYLEDVARASDYRLHVIASWRDIITGQYRLIVTESAPYPVPVSEGGTTEDRVQSLSLVIVLVLLEMEEVLRQDHSVRSLSLIELLLQYAPTEESLDTLDLVMSLSLIELLIQDTADPETLRQDHRVQSLLLTVTVLTTTSDPETLNHTHRVQSLTLSAA